MPEMQAKGLEGDGPIKVWLPKVQGFAQLVSRPEHASKQRRTEPSRTPVP